MKLRSITIVVILSLLAWPYLYFSPWDVSPSLPSKKMLTESQKVDSVKPRLLEETKEVRKSVESLQKIETQVVNASPKILPIKVKLEHIKEININLLEYINNNGGNINKFPIEQQLALAKGLQKCGTRPINNADAIEQEKNNYYFSNLTAEEKALPEKICGGVSDTLILEAYSLFKNAAEEGSDLRAASLFFHSVPPGILKSLMNNTNLEEEKVDKIMVKHYGDSTYLMVDAIYDGDIGATRAMAHFTRRFDAKKALGYYIAANAQYTVIEKDLIRDKFLKGLTQSDIDEAKIFADDLIQHWQSIGGIYIKGN